MRPFFLFFSSTFVVYRRGCAYGLMDSGVHRGFGMNMVKTKKKKGRAAGPLRTGF